MNEEELKPCPFCGKTKKLVETKLTEYGTQQVRCYDCPCDGPESDIGFHTSEWNNAYCWKEIDQLKSALQAKDAEIAELQGLVSRQGISSMDDLEKIKELEETIARLQIDYSKGFYTPIHEADRKRLKAELQAERSRSEKLVQALENIFKEHCDNGCENIALEAIGKQGASVVLSRKSEEARKS